MRTFVGIALGFAMMPATLALIGGFAFLAIHFDLRKSDTVLGAVLGLATFAVVATIWLRVVFDR